ncbi:MAG: glycerophosphodiester phosphodiesterase [Solirubrobacterales bacterium]|nr:glycerophosphodiester phosphodiesterase [Solirubrobacterales bacterium]
MQSFKRIGHGGASALVRANTLGSFEAALELGVDTIEFDVRSRRGELVLAHTVLHAARGNPVRLTDALEHLSAPRFDEVGLLVDVKHAGCEPGVVAALRDAGLMERSMISSQVTGVLDRVRSIEPRVVTAISVGGWVARFSRRWEDWREQVLAGLSSGRWDAVMAQHKLVDTALREEVASRGSALYAWTVNDRRAIGLLRTLGVDGIVTADPRLFG